jgi:hypothetical protein
MSPSVIWMFGFWVGGVCGLIGGIALADARP